MRGPSTDDPMGLERHARLPSERSPSLRLRHGSSWTQYPWAIVPGHLRPLRSRSMAPDVHVSRFDSAGELDLVARAETDPMAFARLFDEYLPRVYAFIARRVEDRAAAEELTE